MRRTVWIAAALVGCLAVVGAIALYTPGSGLHAPNTGRGATYAVVRVLYATDRGRSGGTTPAVMFGDGRADMSYGFCDVSIPRDHRMGELEAPSIRRLEFREDPNKHVVVLETEVQAKDEFLGDLAARVRADPNDSAFLFVHGYNTTFDAAAKRTAQMSYDLGFTGAPVFYSWPSRGTLKGYVVDEQNVEWAQADLKDFLGDFLARSEARNVYVISHSMGSRALTRAVASLLTEKPALRDRVKEVILAAPDIDASVFKRDIAPSLAAQGLPVTLYASSRDKALLASKKAHGYPRAGESGSDLVVVPGIDTVDASKVSCDFIGHWLLRREPFGHRRYVPDHPRWEASRRSLQAAPSRLPVGTALGIPTVASRSTHAARRQTTVSSGRYKRITRSAHAGSG